MKKFTSRLMSVLLSLCMVMGAFSMPVYAEGSESVAEIVEAVGEDSTVASTLASEEESEMVETTTVESEADETEESVSTVETEAVTGEETQEEMELANLQDGATIHIKFKEYWRAKINGEEAGSIEDLDVTVAVSNGRAAFNIPMEAADGYLITSLVSNLSSEFGSSNTVPVVYDPNSKMAQMYFDSSLYIENNTIEITINAVEAAHIMLTFEGSTNLPETCLDQMVIKYLWDDGEDNYGGNYDGSDGGIHLGEYNTFDVYVPKYSQFVITEITDGDDHNLNDFIFWYADMGQRTEKVTTTYNGPYDEYTGLPMIVADKGNIHIVITKKDVEPKNTYTVSCSGAEHAYIGTSANPSTRSFSTEVAKGKALDVYVKCEEGYAIKGISSVSGSVSFEKGIEGLNTDYYKFTIPANRIVADTVITVTTMVKKATVSSNSGNFKIRPIADSTWYNSIPGEYVDNKTSFTFAVKPNTGNVITKVSYTVGDTDIELTAEDGGTDTDGYVYTIPAGLKKDARITVVTARAFDLSKAVVTMYFNDSIKAGKVATYSKEAAESLDGIVPTKVEVKDNSKKALADGEYVISYRDNRATGIGYLTIEPKEGSKVYSGKKEVAFTIKGTNITDTKKIRIDFKAPTSWDNSMYGEGNLPEVKLYDISGDEPVELTLGYPDDEGAIPAEADYIIKANADFDFENNIVKPGAITVDILGVGGYEGIKTYKYTVAKPNFKDATATGDNNTIKITLDKDAYDFTGHAITPEPVVTYKDKTLVKGKDYVIKKYTNNVNSYVLGAGDEGFKAAKAPAIQIQGMGYYQGTKTVNFKINKVSIDDVEVEVPAYKYTKREIKAKPVVCKYDENNNVVKKYVEKVDYTLSYENNIEASEETNVIITPTENGGLAGDARKVHFDIANKNIADSKKIRIMYKVDEDSVDTLKLDFTGEEMPEPVFKVLEIAGNADGTDKELELGKDFEYTLPSALNAGKYRCIVRGIGDYYGKVEKPLIIDKRTVKADDLSDIRVSIENYDFNANNQTSIPEFYYTGYAIKPSIVISDLAKNNYQLREGVDYTIEYSNNTNISKDTRTAVATVRFKGSYVGVAADKTNSFTVKYKINSWDLSEAKDIVVNDGANPVYTGAAIKPSVKMKTPDGNEVNPKMLKLTYVNNVNACSNYSENAPTVKIAPANKNFTAPKVNEKESYRAVTFTIDKASLSSSLNMKVPTQVYKGKAITPNYTIKYRGKALKLGTDYTISYYNNTSRGVAYIKVSIINNHTNFYDDSYVIPFIIK